MSAKKQYNMLLKNGILLELYPEELTGNWLEDKETFTKFYEANLYFKEPLEVEDYEEL
jgi:hypothetical protein